MMFNRLEKLNSKMQAERLEAILVTNQKNIYYLTGLWASFAAVLITPSKRVLITDSRYSILAKETVRDFEIVLVKGDLPVTLSELLIGETCQELGFEDELSVADFKRYELALAPIQLKPLSGFVEGLRLIKDAGEIAAIKKACQISDRAFLDVLNFIKPGKTDQEVANFLEFRMKELGGEGASFDIISVSGERSAMPHGTPSPKLIERGDALTLDFGTFYDHYVSDITRTIFIGHVTEEQEKVYQTVLKANQAVIEAARAGLTYKDYDRMARDLIVSADYGSYFTHSIGHGIGLDIHENPFFSRAEHQQLKAGMVVTDEPGIYLDGNFGVRIEDDLVITETGCEVLTQSPKELIVL